MAKKTINKIGKYDFKKDCKEWELQHGKTPYCGDANNLPKLPKWLSPEGETKCQNE